MKIQLQSISSLPVKDVNKSLLNGSWRRHEPKHDARSKEKPIKQVIRIPDTTKGRSEHSPRNATSVHINHQNKGCFASENRKEKPHENAQEKDKELNPSSSKVKEVKDKKWYEGQQEAKHKRPNTTETM